MVAKIKTQKQRQQQQQGMIGCPFFVEASSDGKKYLECLKLNTKAHMIFDSVLLFFAVGTVAIAITFEG